MCVYIYLARLDIYYIYININKYIYIYGMYMYEGALCMFSDTYIYGMYMSTLMCMGL